MTNHLKARQLRQASHKITVLIDLDRVIHISIDGVSLLTVRMLEGCEFDYFNMLDGKAGKRK